MRINSLDHIVLTVRNIQDSLRFYTEVLGMQAEEFIEGRYCLKFGQQKINLHQYRAEFEPKAEIAQPGSADLCFLVDGQVVCVLEELVRREVKIELGPIQRTGALGAILSIYIRDPDGNLIELSERL